MPIDLPRVCITYDVSTNGAAEARELPFVVGIFADLSGDRDAGAASPAPTDFKYRPFVEVDRDNFNAVLKRTAPRISLDGIDNVLPGGSGKLAGHAVVFESLNDFDPTRVIERVDVLNDVFQQRKALSAAQDEVAAVIDRALAAQLQQVLQCERFKRVEATWRGLFHLVSRTDTNARVKIRLFDATLKELRLVQLKLQSPTAEPARSTTSASSRFANASAATRPHSSVPRP